MLVSYEMACTQYSDANKAAIVKAYLNYMISPEGQQAAAADRRLGSDRRTQRPAADPGRVDEDPDAGSWTA